jgi:hypothetical protein
VTKNLKYYSSNIFSHFLNSKIKIFLIGLYDGLSNYRREVPKPKTEKILPRGTALLFESQSCDFYVGESGLYVVSKVDVCLF